MSANLYGSLDQELRYEAAKAAMQGILAGRASEACASNVALLAVRQADALLAELGRPAAVPTAPTPSYPFYGRSCGTTVLFYEEGCGIVVASTNDTYPVGRYSEIWKMPEFKPVAVRVEVVP